MEKIKATVQDLLVDYPLPEGSDLQIFSAVAIRSRHGTYAMPLRCTTLPNGIDLKEAVSSREAMLELFRQTAVVPFASLTSSLTDNREFLEKDAPDLMVVLPPPPPIILKLPEPPIVSDVVEYKRLMLEPSGQFTFPWSPEALQRPQPVLPLNKTASTDVEASSEALLPPPGDFELPGLSSDNIVLPNSG